MTNNKTEKTSLLDPENRLKESMAKLPEWAKPIAEKYLELYRDAANQVHILEPDAIVKFGQTAREIVEEMTAEIKKEAERRGYQYIVATKKKAETQAMLTDQSKRKGNKQLKN